MRCFVYAGFLLTSASRGSSAIAEPLVVVVVVSVDVQLSEREKTTRTEVRNI